MKTMYYYCFFFLLLLLSLLLEFPKTKTLFNFNFFILGHRCHNVNVSLNNELSFFSLYKKL